jgi:hypothetical protein
MNKVLLNRIGEYLWFAFLISLVGYCTYSGFKGNDEDKKKWIPTEENIAKWEERKREWLSGRICERMDDEVIYYKKDGKFCSEKYSEVYKMGKFVAQMNNAWFDANHIPKDYRSLNDLNISKNSLHCQEQVRAWDNCPTGFSYRR